jgi:parvulin-like peptidyl-prolyl isomerase
MLFRLSSLLLASSLALSAQASSPVLGRIGDIEITVRDINEELISLGPDRAAALAKDPNSLGQYVRTLLLQKFVLKQAADEKWDQKPDVIAQLVRAREAALAESFLSAAAKPDDAYPSDAEVKTAYEANKDRLVIPKAYRIAQIFIAVPKDAGKEAEAAASKKLDGIKKQLAEKSADFAAIARVSSEEPASAANGGEIGWLTEEQIQPDIRTKLPGLKLESVSEPIRLDDGWHIIKVLEAREARTPTLDEIRDNLVTSLRDEKARAVRQEYISELLRKNPIAVNEIELMKLGSSDK